MEQKEKCQVSASVNDGILEIVITGDIIQSNYKKVTDEVNAVIKANKAKQAIADFRAVEKRIAPSEMYRYFRNYNSSLFDISYAIIDLPQNIQYKTAAINAGLSSLNWFTDMESARAWMKNKGRSNPDHY